MLTHEQLNKLVTYVRSKIVSQYDPASLFSYTDDIRKELSYNHCGLYIGIIGSDNEDLIRSGFLQENLTSVIDSAESVIKNLYDALKEKNIPVNRVKTSTFYFDIVTKCVFMPDPLAWDENRDGVYFMWGQKYRSVYLPYQIRRMNLPKIDILDRLCSFGAGVASNLWRLPCGLCWRLVCQSYSA